MQNISQGIPGADVAQSKTEMVQFKAKLDGLRQRLQGGDVKEKELRKACQDFEAVFIGKLWEKMRDSIPEGELLHSKQEKMYLSMFDRAFSEKMAEDGGIGLQDMMYDQLKEKLDKAGKETLPSSLGAPNEVRPLADAEGVRIKSLREGMDHTLEGREGLAEEPVFDSAPASEAAFGDPVEQGAAASTSPSVAMGQAEINRKVDELAMRIQMEAGRNVASTSGTARTGASKASGTEAASVAPAAADGGFGALGGEQIAQAESIAVNEQDASSSVSASGTTAAKAPTRSDLAMARATKVYNDINAEAIVARLAGNLHLKP